MSPLPFSASLLLVLSTDLTKDGSLLPCDNPAITDIHGLRIEPILNDCGELERVLVGRCHFTSNFCAVNYCSLYLDRELPLLPPSHNVHVVKFGTGTLVKDLVEQIWGVYSS